MCWQRCAREKQLLLVRSWSGCGCACTVWCSAQILPLRQCCAFHAQQHGYAAVADTSRRGFCIVPAGTGRPAWGFVYFAMMSSIPSMPSFDARTSMRCCFSVPGAVGAPCGTSCRCKALDLTGRGMGALHTILRAASIAPALLGRRLLSTAITTPLCIRCEPGFF